MRDIEPYMIENFDVKIEPERNGYGHEFMATHNGYQWTAINFYTKEQILEAAKKLQDYAEKLGE